MRRITNSIRYCHDLYKLVFFIFVVFSTFSFVNAEEFVSDYEKEPKLKIFYGNHREKKFPIDVHELIPFKISDQSYTQEFNLKITAMKGSGAHLFIGVYKGLQILVLPNGCIYLNAFGTKGFIAQSPKKTLKCNITYVVKINYNRNTLSAQCIVSKKDDLQVIWDSKEVLCDPLFSVSNIHFASKHIKKDPTNSKSEIFWSKQDGCMILCSIYKHGILKAIVDNMKIMIKK